MNLAGDEKTGLNILKESLESPIKQIAENSGFDGAVVVEKVKNNQGAFGFNGQTMVYEDLILAGIVDPTKVVRAALENAASAASMFLTIEAVVGEEPDKEKKENPSMGPMNMGY